MHTTSPTLLEKVRQPENQEAWERFVRLYTPLLFRWGRAVGLNEADADDLVQEVLILLVRKLPEFAYDPGQSFRAWLHTLTRNKWREGLRRRKPQALPPDAAALLNLQDRHAGDPFDETEYRDYLTGRALELIQTEFQPVTWQAFTENMIAEKPAAEVARHLGITVNAVYLAKAHVLRRLRRELDGLLDL